MSINEADLAQYVQRTEKRIEALEADIRRMTQNEGRWMNTNMLHPLSTNLSNIREMFLLEIIREAGLLESVDLEKISAKVRAQLVDAKRIPWANANRTGGKSAQQLAADNFDTVISEIKGFYDRADDKAEE